MPRYLVERTLPDGLPAPVGAEGAAACPETIVDRNADYGVTWIHSYIANEGHTMLLRVRRPDAGGDSPQRDRERPAGRPDHAGPGPHPYSYA